MLEAISQGDNVASGRIIASDAASRKKINLMGASLCPPETGSDE
jgi:hypothetical protein